jgi:hypothetical protein
MTSLEHIHPEFRHVMALSDSERIAFMDEPRWIGHRAAQQILDLLQGLLNKPQRPRMPNLLIVGESNNGKTTIIRRFKELCGQAFVDVDASPVKPIVLAEAPPSADEKGLYISILEQFWAPYRATDSVSKLRYQVVHLARACKVRMLMIDELHSLLTGSPVKQREVMNALKLLCNELSIPIVGAGTRDAVRVLHADAQHASRFDVVSLPLWTQDKDFQRLLAGFERILPLRHPSRFFEAKTAQLLHAISGGNTGNLHRLLVECAKDAIKTGAERIDLAIIETKSWLRPTQGVREIMA